VTDAGSVVNPPPNTIASAELVAFLDEACAAASDMHEVSGPLMKRSNQGDNDAGWLATAFDYMLPWHPWKLFDGDKTFGQMLTGGFGSYPMPLGELPPEVLDLWASAAEQSAAPAAIARLNHLLFHAKRGHAGERLRAAAIAYRALAHSSRGRHDRVSFAAWSRELYQRVGDVVEAKALLSILEDLARESMDQEKREPGVALLAIEAIVRADAAYPVLDDLLDVADARYAKDPHIRQGVIELRLRTHPGDVAKRDQLRRAKVQVPLDHAETLPPGINQMMFLEDAARLAHRHGFTDLEAKATAMLQKITEADLGLVRIESKGEIPMAVFDDAVGALLATGTMTGLLEGLARGESPTGDHDTNGALSEELAKEAPLATLFPTKLLGPDSMPQYTAETDEDREDERLATVENYNLGINGEIAARALEQGFAAFIPTAEELETALAVAPRVSSAVARSMARSLIAFRDGRFEDAAVVAMTRVETLVREVCRDADRLAYRTQDGRSRGGYPQLGGLLSALNEVLDPSWYRFLHTYLVSPFGSNYRNELFHGYVKDVSRVRAALTIVAALYLAHVIVQPLVVVD